MGDGPWPALYTILQFDRIHSANLCGHMQILCIDFFIPLILWDLFPSRKVGHFLLVETIFNKMEYIESLHSCVLLYVYTSSRARLKQSTNKSLGMCLCYKFSVVGACQNSEKRP